MGSNEYRNILRDSAGDMYVQNKPYRRPPGGRVPDGWEFFCEYQDCALFVEPLGTRPDDYRVLALMPCKVPLAPAFRKGINALKDQFCSDIQPQTFEGHQRHAKRFEAKLGVDELRHMERDRKTSSRWFDVWEPSSLAGVQSIDLRAVISLCATERYYDGRDFESRGIDYIWKETAGQAIPKDREVYEFIDLWHSLFDRYSVVVRMDCLKDFIDHERIPTVAVHCTHGVNRTGFLFSCLVQTVGTRVVFRNRKSSNPWHDHHVGLDLFGEVRGHYVNKDELCAGVESFSQNVDKQEFEESRGPCYVYSIQLR